MFRTKELKKELNEEKSEKMHYKNKVIAIVDALSEFRERTNKNPLAENPYILIRKLNRLVSAEIEVVNEEDM